ncbi:MAG: hypothetical protein JST42_30235 [Bacteroidetes bacterium]|nr:hypothetical protein [Bacteroidota bacterium]
MTAPESYVVPVLPGRWGEIKTDTMIQEFSAIFSSWPVIEFPDWAGVSNASDFWDGLYTDVAKPLKKKDTRFIFHLGDVSKKPSFEIDEALDIIGDYSSIGNVQLKMDSHEADSLWCKLNGCDTAALADPRCPEAQERYHFLFNMMNVGSLMVVDGSGPASEIIFFCEASR